jgi:predicted house-cleaning noncanonical NTP pyrophosphatase (MazG superfamily)
MLLPSLKRFVLNKTTQEYQKSFIYNNETYCISVPVSEWSRTVRLKINRILKKDNILIRVLPYSAKITKLTNDTVSENQCPNCECTFINYDNLRKHEARCGLQNIRIYNNITHNDNSINIHNHYHDKVEVNQFGKENMEWITDNVLRHLTHPRLEAIKYIIASKHFNDNFPENQNIRLNTKKDIKHRIQVFKRGKWRLSNTKHILITLCMDMADLVFSALDGCYADDYEDKVKSVIETFRSSEFYGRIQPKLNELWGNINNIIDDEKEEDLMDILTFLLLDKRLQDDQSKE